MWPTYKQNESIETEEPKFTNNVGSLALRPSFKTSYCNAFISTAYIKETIDIFSMEAAAIAGKNVASAISKFDDPGTIRPRPLALLLAPLWLIDRALVKLGCSHLSALFGGSTVTMMVVYMLVLGVLLFLLIYYCFK